MAEGKRILVTGANTGIGLALCKQLCEKGCQVLLGARNLEKGAKAVEEVKAFAPGAAVELVQIDVGSDESVFEAAKVVKDRLGDEPLFAIVNNAGTGLAHGTGSEEQINTNFNGIVRVCKSFIPLLSPSEGRVVNVGSGAGPMYVNKQPIERQKLLCNPEISMEEIQRTITEGLETDSMGGYGVSKACVAAYTMLLAREHPKLLCSCLSPGFINTAIVSGFGATKPPEEGTVSLKHCLFGDLPGNGWFWGSDALRSPLNVLRNPGEPEFSGEYEW